MSFSRSKYITYLYKKSEFTMNPKIYKGQQVQMIDVMGNVRFTEDTIYSTHGTIFKFI